MYEELLETARRAAERAAPILRRYFRQEDLEVRRKGANDFVSRADRESEAVVVGLIRERHPDHAILAEEGGEHESGGEYQWLIDPLDGTTNFLQGLPNYAISIGCRHGERVVAGVIMEPEAGDLFTAVRGGGAHWNGRPIQVSRQRGLDGSFLATGYPFKARAAVDLYLAIFRTVFLRARAIRRCGAAAMDLAYTAAGVYDGFFEFRLSPWDLAAGALLIQEAGGTVTDLDGGSDYLESGSVVAGAAGVHRDLLQSVGEHGGEAALEVLEPRPTPQTC